MSFTDNYVHRKQSRNYPGSGLHEKYSTFNIIRAPSQYPKRRLSVRSRKFSKPRDQYFKLSYRFKTWQAHRQRCCRSACQISERSDNSKYKSRGFETLRDLTERRLFGYWDGAQKACNNNLIAGHSYCADKSQPRKQLVVKEYHVIYYWGNKH